MPGGRLQHAHLWTGAFSFAGVSVAHLLGYWLAVPDGSDRHHVLAATGHRYWGLFVAVALAALAAALCRITVGVLQEDETASPLTDFKTVAARLVVWQAPVLLLLEAAERVAVDGHLHVSSLLTEAPVLVGLVVQFVVAVAGAVLVVAWARAVSLVARARRSVDGRNEATWPPHARLLPVHRPHAGSRTPRGPPLPS